MAGIRADGFYRLQIEALHIHQRFKAARAQHIHKIARDSAAGKASVNLITHHHVHQIFRRRQRSAAGAGLERKSIL